MQPPSFAPSVREAARRAVSAWKRDDSDLADADLTREIETLVLLLEQGSEYNARELAGPPLGFVRRRLLEQLRIESMRLWNDDPAAISAADMLQAVMAFEAAGNALDPAAEPATRTRDAPNGLELLVEVAHDFRAALTSIIYLSEALRRGEGGDLTEVQRHQLGIIYQAAMTLITTANDVIELTSAADHLIESETAAFSLTHTLDSVYSVVRPIAEEKGLELKVTPPRDHVRIGRVAALNRVLLNLTTNALKSTQHGRVEIEVTEYDDDRVEFAVRDTGPGIPPDVLATLYEPFRKTTTRESGYYFSGSGLGLAICWKLLKAMGSQLRVETAPESGTCFSFDLELPRVNR